MTKRILACVALASIVCTSACSDDNGLAGSAGTGATAGTNGTGGGGGTGASGGTPLALLDQYLLSDDQLVPESGDYDSQTNAFYVGSATKGSVTRIAANGTETVFYEPPGGEVWRTLGTEVDEDSRRLFACTRQIDGGGQVILRSILVLDLDSGAQEALVDLSDSGFVEADCNDVAVDQEGLAYVTDSRNPHVYRIDATAGTVEIWANDPLLAPAAAGLGLNGIAVTSDNRYVIAAKTLALGTAGILRIDRNDAATIEEVTVSPGLSGTLDGIAFQGDTLYVAIVAPGAIARLTSTNDWSSAVFTRTTAPSGTSTVIATTDRVYAVYSDILSEITNAELNPPFRIFRIEDATFE